MQHQVYLGLGSNLDNPKRQLKAAIVALRQLPQSQLVRVSSFYESKPMGPKDQPDFLNAVAELKTHLTPFELLQCTQRIERQQKRVKTQVWGPRTIDIDILLYDKAQIHSPELIIPHPGLCERAFVIIPLFEIAPEIQLPKGQSIAHLYEHFTELVRNP